MSITPASDVPISISYTGRDYYSIREQLITQIQNRVNVNGQTVWTASNPADFGVALVEAFAYMGDLMSYYIDRNVNESFIATATQRSSVLNIAQSYGYIPAGYRASSVLLTFLNSSLETDVATLIPAGTIVSGDIVVGDTVRTVYFTTTEDITSDPLTDSGTVTINAVSGQSITRLGQDVNQYGELIGCSTGLPRMVFSLLEYPVVDGSITVYVQDQSTYSKWKQVQHLIDYGPYDQVFTVSTDENSLVYVTFGDGVSGKIPTNNSEIRALYRVGGGDDSNVALGSITDISYVPGLTPSELNDFQSKITVINAEAAIGGSDPESLNQIRYAAPIALRSNNRAVTLDDYSGLALQVGNVGKANASARTWTSVNLYLAPTRNADNAGLAPGLDDGGFVTPEWETMASDVIAFLEDKILLGTTINYSPPTYVDVSITIEYIKFPEYSTEEIDAALKSAIITNFGYVNVDFEQTFHRQDIEFVLNQVSGIKVATVIELYRTLDSAALTVLTGNAWEIFRFQEANIAVSGS